MRLLLCSALLAAVCAAQAPNTLTPAEKKAGWRLLFDGHGMTGWQAATADSWTIEDGCLKSLPGARLRQDLISTDKFKDFEMTFEWKVAPGSNSGVKYLIQDTVLVDPHQMPQPLGGFERQVAYAMEHRTAKPELVQPKSDAQIYPVAYEYQVIDDERHPDAKRNPSSRAGALYRMAAPAQAAARPVGEFNQGRIVKRGNHVEHWLNGVKVVDTELDSAEVRAQIESRWPVGHPVCDLLEKMPRAETPVGLQNHGDVAWFRNIRIRTLAR
jgi:hypothetical protein